MYLLGDDQRKEIERITQGGARFDEPMSEHTTFRAGGCAEVYIEAPRTIFFAVLQFAAQQDIPCLVIGNGSNILVGDGGISGIVLSTAGMSTVNTDTEQNIVVAEAGALLSRVANGACKAGLSGLEFAGGIPGSVGGAVFMNAGAYGGEIADVIIDAECVDVRGGVFRLGKEELALSYRHSCIGERDLIVLSASFGLKRDDEEAIRERMRVLSAKRAEKQPLEYASAGSAFKRPEGHFAAALIEEAGLKGYMVGDAGVSEKHSGFIINKGKATAAEIRQVFTDVADKVYGHSGVRLEPEVRFVGDF